MMLENMKTLHLVCNAHLDPVWMWDWDEGADAALATFYSALELSKNYDYIFCHNEVLLYEYIERYAPKLFQEIQKLVKAGKWHIMGGWYLQPDCTIPSGEAFIRQISVGREYFDEKFNVRPTTAVNFDSFGHTRGLVQILKKCGYDSYLFCRPMPEFLSLPDNPFLWKGYDGSLIKALRIEDLTIYCSGLGTAKQDILRKAEAFKNASTGLIAWGVGNHGGGASRKDLDDILELQDEKKGEYRLIHSTPEAYFAEVKPTKTFDQSLLPCFIKSYSSISAIKQKQCEFEHFLFQSEKACSIAALETDYVYPRSVFHDAERSLSAMAFHDVLSGTCVERGLKSTLRRADAAIENLNQEFLLAFHRLAEHYPTAKEGENPLTIFSFQPYERDEVVETEFLIPNALISDDEAYVISVYQDGKKIPSQVIKEESNINYDRRKKVAYFAHLSPLGTSQVVLKYAKSPKKVPVKAEEDLTYHFADRVIRINRTSGLLDSYQVDGKEYLSGGAFLPVMFDDNADPWGWYLKKLGTHLTPFVLSNEAKEGPFAGLSGVHVLEEGAVLSQVEALFALKSSYVRVVYTLHHLIPCVDVDVEVFWNEPGRGLKLAFPLVEEGSYFGQEAYGTESFESNGNENVSQRFVGVEENGKVFTLYNKGTYGNAKEGNILYLTLLNGSAYCAHPIEDRPLLPSGRFSNFIEQGHHHFAFRLSVNERDECERKANEYLEAPYSVNRYPHGDGVIPTSLVRLSNPNVVLESLRQSKDGGYILRLFANVPSPSETRIRFKEDEMKVSLSPYAFVTLTYERGHLALVDDAAIY